MIECLLAQVTGVQVTAVQVPPVGIGAMIALVTFTR
jgi:hypothetical protein